MTTIRDRLAAPGVTRPRSSRASRVVGPDPAGGLRASISLQGGTMSSNARPSPVSHLLLPTVVITLSLLFLRRRDATGSRH
jgi:hypothetical protein